MKIRALSNRLLATKIEYGEQTTASGIVLLNDDGKESGVRARWMQVYSKGKNVTDQIQEGDWIYVQHGRWTREMRVQTADKELSIWGIDPDSVLLVSEERPDFERVIK